MPQFWFLRRSNRSEPHKRVAPLCTKRFEIPCFALVAAAFLMIVTSGSLVLTFARVSLDRFHGAAHVFRFTGWALRWRRALKGSATGGGGARRSAAREQDNTHLNDAAIADTHAQEQRSPDELSVTDWFC